MDLNLEILLFAHAACNSEIEICPRSLVPTCRHHTRLCWNKPPEVEDHSIKPIWSSRPETPFAMLGCADNTGTSPISQFGGFFEAHIVNYNNLDRSMHCPPPMILHLPQLSHSRCVPSRYEAKRTKRSVQFFLAVIVIVVTKCED